MGRQVHNLVNRIGDSRIPHGRRVIPVPLHHGYELLWKLHAAQGYHALNLFFIYNRHDPGFHRNPDARQVKPIPETVKILVVKKELGNQLADPCIHLLLKVPDVLHQVP